MKKKDKIQLVFIGIVVIVTAVFLSVRKKGENEEKQLWISRPESGTKKQSISLTFGETTEEWMLNVEPREKSAEEIESAFTETIRRLDEMFGVRGGKSTVLTESVALPEHMEETGVDIRWNSSDAAVLSKEGVLQREHVSEVCVIHLQARMRFAGEERERWFAVEVPPYEPGSADALLFEARESLTELERKTVGEDGFYLPSEIGAVAISLPETPGVLPGLLAVTVLCLPFAVIISKRQEKEKERKQREAAFLTAYPQLITKLTLYTGAGMSLRGAWERLATEYRVKAEDSGKREVVGEEIFILAGELKNGTPEAKAYEAFGRRIGLKPYLRCASLLISQLQKGSGGLRKGLENEVQMAWEMHREQAAKKGEEAQTKMLFPMMGMLFLVMAVVMIPAFFSM